MKKILVIAIIAIAIAILGYYFSQSSKKKCNEQKKSGTETEATSTNEKKSGTETDKSDVQKSLEKIKKEIEQNWNWNEKEYRQAKEYLASIMILEKNKEPRLDILKESLEKCPDAEKGKDWYKNVQILVNFADMVKDEISLACPDKLWELRCEICSVSKSYKQLPTSQWKLRQKQYEEVKEMLTKLPLFSLKDRELLENLGSYDLKECRYIEYDSTLLDILDLLDLYKKLTPEKLMGQDE